MSEVTARGGEAVLVTCGAGLLGSWVGRKLAEQGASVTAIDIDWSRWNGIGDPRIHRVEGDIRDIESVAALLTERRVDTVIHLAARSLVEDGLRDPAATFDHNVRGTWAILDACRRSDNVSSIVAASSDKAYGDIGNGIYTEEMPLLARNPYDASKACGDIAAQAFAASFGVPVAITRCGNLYGGGDLHWSRIVPGTIRSALRGEPPIIRSDGRSVRDYLYVEDAADGILTLAQELRRQPSLAGEAFNLSAEERQPVLALVSRILELMGASLEPQILATAANEIPARPRE